MVFLSRDGLHAPVTVLIGLALLCLAVVLFRSDLRAHRPIAAVTGVVGAFAAATMLLGPESLGPTLIGPWALVIGVVMLVARRQLQPPQEAAPGAVSQGA